MARLTADDLIDLGRWSSVQFRDQDAAEAAMDRYQRYLERQKRGNVSQPPERPDGGAPGQAA